MMNLHSQQPLGDHNMEYQPLFKKNNLEHLFEAKQSMKVSKIFSSNQNVGCVCLIMVTNQKLCAPIASKGGMG